MISIVIVAYYKHQRLRRLLRELEATRGEFRCVIVRNSRGVGIRRAVDDFAGASAHEVDVIDTDTRFTPALNAGLRRALPGSETVFYMCSVHAKVHDPSWLEHCAGWMRSNPGSGLGGCVQGTGRLGAHFGNRHGIWMYTRSGDMFDHLEHIDKGWWAKADKRRLDHVQGGFWAISPRMVADIGLPFERFYHGFVDVEYSYRAMSRGWALGDIPGVVASEGPDPSHPPGTLVSHDRGVQWL